MDTAKGKFLRDEFLTMSLLGARGRSRTYSDSASKEDKLCFRNALRGHLDRISRKHGSGVSAEKHNSNINKISEDLTLRFGHCLRNGKFEYHLFEYLGNAKYRVLGKNYPFVGPILWKGRKIGEWNVGSQKPTFFEAVRSGRTFFVKPDACIFSEE